MAGILFYDDGGKKPRQWRQWRYVFITGDTNFEFIISCVCM